MTILIASKSCSQSPRRPYNNPYSTSQYRTECIYNRRNVRFVLLLEIISVAVFISPKSDRVTTPQPYFTDSSRLLYYLKRHSLLPVHFFSLPPTREIPADFRWSLSCLIHERYYRNAKYYMFHTCVRAMVAAREGGKDSEIARAADGGVGLESVYRSLSPGPAR